MSEPVPSPLAAPRIREAGAGDADELARLRWEFSAEAHEPAEERSAFLERMATSVRRYLAGAWTIWVVENPEEAGRLVGCLYLQRVEKVPRPYPRAAHLGYVTSVYLAPRWRQGGIGTRLVDAAVARAREEGLDLLILWPSPRAETLYRRAGFRTSPDGLEHPLGSG